MTADGFLQQKQRHPVAMAAALSINIAAVTALMLAKSGVVPIPPNIIKLIPISEPVPPPPHNDPPPPRHRTEQQRKIWTPEPQPSREATEHTDVSGTTDAGGGAVISDPGPSTDIKPIDPPKPPEPVTVGPQPDPRYAGDYQPPYPPQLLRTGVEGKAVVRVLIGADGRVRQVEIVSADDPLFADATERQALRKWRFRPATRDGVAFDSWTTMTVKFQIRS